MARYLILNVDACTFEQCDLQTAVDTDLPVIVNDGGDVHVQIDGDTQLWPSDGPLLVAGVQFDQEGFL